MNSFAFSYSILLDIEVIVEYLRNSEYKMRISNETHHVSGKLSDTDGKADKLTCTVDGVRSDVVLFNHRETLHLFSVVRKRRVWRYGSMFHCILFQEKCSSPSRALSKYNYYF